MAGKLGKNNGYVRGSSRSGGQGQVFSGVKEITPDDIWTQPQRDLFRDINWARQEIENVEKLREQKIDYLALKVLDMLDTGMKKTRVARVFRMSPAYVADLAERGNTVRAIMAQEAK